MGKVAKKDEVKDFVNKLMPAIAESLPQLGATEERFAKVAMLALRKDPKLMACDQASIAECLIVSASLNLEPNTPQQLAYLIPYGKECTFIISYRGLVELARRSGQIADIYAEIVREGDIFNEVKGLSRDITHIDGTDNRDAPIVKAYAVCHFINGTKTYETVDQSDVDRIIKNVKRGKAGNIWDLWPEEMWKKTAIRRLCKYLPSSVIENRVHEILEKEVKFQQPEPRMISAGIVDYAKKPDEVSADDAPTEQADSDEMPNFKDM